MKPVTLKVCFNSARRKGKNIWIPNDDKGKIHAGYSDFFISFLLDNNNEGILCVFPIEHWLNVLNACAAAVYSSHLQMKWGCKNLGKDSWTESCTSVYRPSLAHNMLLETMT